MRPPDLVVVMQQKKKLRHVPKILSDELQGVLLETDCVFGEKTMDLLRAFRGNRSKSIATWGILSIGDPVPCLQPMSFQHSFILSKLDDAFQKMHHFKNGGASDYTAEDVERAINAIRASGTRSRKSIHQEIGAFLKRRDYSSSSNKKAIVLDAASHFECSESTINRAIKKFLAS